jgi:hypothetical protein
MVTRKHTPDTRKGPPSTIRFEATLGAAPRAKAVKAASELDLDRLPDAKGEVTLLLSPDDARRLLEQGFEVHLKAAVPVAPLAKERVMSDTQAQRWLEEQVKGLPRARPDRPAKTDAAKEGE